MPIFDPSFIEKNFLSSSKKISSQKIRSANKDLIDQLKQHTDSRCINEAIYLIYNDIAAAPRCVCGNRLELKSFTAGYRKFCSCRCSSHSDSTISARRQTCLNKYGVESVSQSAEIKQKIVDTNIKKRGHAYPMSDPAVLALRDHTNQSRFGGRAPMSSSVVKQKVKQTNCQKYGGTSPMASRLVYNKSRITQIQNWFPNKIRALAPYVTPNFGMDEYRDVDREYPWTCNRCTTSFLSILSNGRIPRCPTCYPHIPSRPEQEVANFVQSLGVVIKQRDKKILTRQGRHPLELDIVIESHHLAIEFNGLYTHSQLHKHYHLDKTTMASTKGYRLIHIFEDEWRDQQSIVQSKIRDALGMNNTIGARKCQIVTVSAVDEREFLIANHIQGYAPSSVCLGLEHQGILVAVMSMAKPRYNSRYDWELLRYASNPNIVGGAGRLLSQFRKQHDGSVISYCDRRYGTGNLYAKLGFKLTGTSPPSYWYTDYTNRFSRIRFQKHRLKKLLPIFDPTLTEEENMTRNGYSRIYDCGNWVFTLD